MLNWDACTIFGPCRRSDAVALELVNEKVEDSSRCGLWML